MRTAEEWFSAYGESHTNPVNKLIHFICIPLIMLSLFGLLWSIPMPPAVAQVSPWLNVATVFVVFSWLFYVRTNLSLAAGMLLVVGTMLAAVALLHRLLNADHGLLALVSVGIFAVSWVFQFIGHNIEGKKPSFLTDLQFLFIGPLWILGFLYRKLGIRY